MTTDTATYHLACHCQTHVIQVDLPLHGLFEDNGVCDCSHCLKRRIIWGAAPKGSLHVIRGLGLNGSEQLQEYRFGSKSFAHQSCGKCGTFLLGGRFDPNADSYMYNVRAIRDDHFDLWQLPLKVYGGLDRPPPYAHSQLDDLPGAAEYLEKLIPDSDSEHHTYVGSCHCQAVKFAVRSKTLGETLICDCACSICLGNGVLWLYPPQKNVFFHPPQSANTPYIPAKGLLTEYTFGSRTNGHFICKTCGCEIYEARSPEDPESGSFGLNIALLNDIGQYLHDAHGMDPDGKQLKGKGGAKLRGLDRDDEARSLPPLYQLRL